ncbi:MAG: hypothetical protein C0616_13745 [Desulfuromonas sp.]|nr:MAG: hypothetical protein C0616_13745 [Desulfuromonas sp.]
MRLALKHQILLAPAAVLLLMSLLLGFLQFSYWDLSLKRQESKRHATLFMSVAEADLAINQLDSILQHILQTQEFNQRYILTLQELHQHLKLATQRIFELYDIPKTNQESWAAAVEDLDPNRGFQSDRFNAALQVLKQQVKQITDELQSLRGNMSARQGENIDELVARTTFVSILVLGLAILVGILLSLYMARSLLRRIQFLSESAGRVAAGDLAPPPAPLEVHDELDDLAISINQMTDRLIRVVGTEKVLEGVEEERRRIAMDIHDQTLADLGGISRSLQMLPSAECSRERVDQLQQDLQKAISNLREVMDNLHPQTLEILGLGPALESHIEQHRLRSSGLELNYFEPTPCDSSKLPLQTVLTIYRIATEALHNVIKHAQGNKCEVTLSKRGNDLLLAVEDNGVGFNLPEAQLKGGRGLNNIEQRARSIAAVVTWNPSRFSSGTRFELRLPL